MTIPKAEETAAFVVVKNRRGAERTVELRRERGAWRVHQTDFSKLPPAQDLRPKLLPSDIPTVPTAAEPTPAAVTPPAIAPTDSSDEADDSDKAEEPTDELEAPETDDDDDVEEPSVEPTPADQPVKPDTDF